MNTDDLFALESPEDELADKLAQLPARLVEALVELRHGRKIDAKDLARLMNRHPSQVSRFENEESDPRLSTIIRYAYAVGADLDFDLEPVDVHGYATHRDADVIEFPFRLAEETRAYSAVASNATDVGARGTIDVQYA